MKKALAIIEAGGGRVRTTSLNLVAEVVRHSRQGGFAVQAVVYGAGVDANSLDWLADYGIEACWCLADRRLMAHNPELIVPPLGRLLRQECPDLVFLAHTFAGADLAPRLAQAYSCRMFSNVSEVDFRRRPYLVTRIVQDGRIWERAELAMLPALITLRPQVLCAHTPIWPQASGKVKPLSLKPLTPVNCQHLSYIVTEIAAAGNSKKAVADADIIVSGGKGLKSAAGFVLLEELAEVLGGTVGASRAAVDTGWRPFADQVGQTGARVKPRLYIACGISGAEQHAIGIAGAEVIIAINKDPDAPIFKLADYGVIGDLFQIIPRLTQELRRQLADQI
ncbi:MAG: electron transfer flavoprotein subunit alpha/FixB family protein [Negativicutes bacterium]|nr:electron transfer flavoprotein subunit alpha/FixB family protein [Negativicutes bacterium]